MEDENKVSVTKTEDTGKDQPSQKVYTEEEKAAFNLKKKADEAKALGLDPKKVLGVEDDSEVPEWYRKEKAKEQTQTALQMADKISDEETREQVKTYLQTRIVPSGNPDQDFKDALGAVSSGKNKQVIEEIQRYTSPKVIASGGSADAKLEEEFVPTPEELVFMRKPYNMTKEQVIEARKKAQAKGTA